MKSYCKITEMRGIITGYDIFFLYYSSNNDLDRLLFLFL